MSKVVYLPVKLIPYLKEGELENAWDNERDWCSYGSGLLDESRAKISDLCSGLSCINCVADADTRWKITNGSKTWRLEMYSTEKRGS